MDDEDVVVIEGRSEIKKCKLADCKIVGRRGGFVFGERGTGHEERNCENKEGFTQPASKGAEHTKRIYSPNRLMGIVFTKTASN
jgi:hypothetical protein